MRPISFLYKKLYRHKYQAIGLQGYRTGRVPAVLFFEPTNACDLECKMCPRKAMKRPIGQLSLELYASIIGQGAGRGLTHVYFQGFGEPLINKRTPEFIRRAKEKGLHAAMTVNGSFLDRRMALELIESGLDEIHFSVDGFRDSTFLAVRGKDNLPRIRENVLAFLDLMKGRSKPTVEVQIIMMPETEGDIKEFNAFWRKKLKGVPHSGQLVKEYNNWGGKVERPAFLPAAVFRSHVRVPCRRLAYAMAVNHDGAAVACCNDFDNALPVGDLKAQTLEEVWTGEPMQALRRAHIQASLDAYPLCQECDSSKKYPFLTLYSNIRKLLNR